jgi:hypothetical protein
MVVTTGAYQVRLASCPAMTSPAATRTERRTMLDSVIRWSIHNRLLVVAPRRCC